MTLTYLNQNDLLPDRLRGVPTHPYPLYEALLEGVLLGLLWLGREPLGRVPGLRFLTAAIGYAAIRFGLTFMRQETVVAFGLEEAQLIALVTGAIALVLLALRVLPRLGPAPTVVGSDL